MAPPSAAPQRGAREARAPLGRRLRVVVFIFSVCFSMIFRDFGQTFVFWPGFRRKGMKKGAEKFLKFPNTFQAIVSGPCLSLESMSEPAARATVKA